MFRPIGTVLPSSLHSLPLKASSMNRPAVKKGTSHAGLRNMHTFLCICRLGYCKMHSARPWLNLITTTCLEGSTYVNLCLRTYFHSHQHNHKHHTTHTHTCCSFSRQKVLNNPSQDRDLVLPSFLFFGVDPDDTAAFNDPLTFHDFRVPIVSEQQVTFNLVCMLVCKYVRMYVCTYVDVYMFIHIRM